MNQIKIIKKQKYKQGTMMKKLNKLSKSINIEKYCPIEVKILTDEDLFDL